MSALLVIWRWLFAETTADKLRREAAAVHCRARNARWEARKQHIVDGTKAAAAKGDFRFLVWDNDGDRFLFERGSAGAAWARSEGLKLEYQLTLFGGVTILRWSR